MFNKLWSYQRVRIIPPISNTLKFERNFRDARILRNKSNLDASQKPIKDENGLYYGKFTEEEYLAASKYVTEQLNKLESDIKGSTNIRENIGQMPMFPPMANKEIGIKLDNLTNILAETIKTTGPISLSAYMRQCLTHPEFGYYTTRNPLDAVHGDFITSPEISSMFGEMIGIWLYSTWLNQNKPSKLKLIEFGPGKGTLIFDCLKSFNKLNKHQSDIEIILIEASPILRKEQWKLLCGLDNEFGTTEEGFNKSRTIWGNNIIWVDNEKDVQKNDDIANYVIAHEFFDALPIKLFVRTEDGWRELVVEHSPSVVNTQQGLPEKSSDKATRSEIPLETDFHLTLANKETPSSMIPKMSSRYKDLPIGTRIEICTEAELYVMKMANLLNSKKKLGSVLIIDYGLSQGIPENSLRGILKHKFVSPFVKPGEVDLSVDVDFENIKFITSNICESFGPVDQGDWLHEVGIGYRTDQLIKSNEDNYEVQEKIYNAYRRLTDKDEKGMGKIYKFLCLLPQNSKSPIGFGALH